MTRGLLLIVLVAAACGGGNPPAVTPTGGSGSGSGEGSATAAGGHRYLSAAELALPPAERGAALADKAGCLKCHSPDGTPMVGPTLVGLWARTAAGTTTFTTGQTLADLLGPGKQFPTVEDYVRVKILTPAVVQIAGYPPSHPVYEGILTDDDVAALLAYLQPL